MKKKVKGIHDITTSLYRARIPENREAPKRLGRDSKKRYFKKGEGTISAPRVWSFSTKPKFTRYQKSIERSLFVERIEEPKTNVFEKTDNLVIMVELPDVKKEDIHWEISNDIFSVRSQDKFGSKKYMKEMLLPFVAEEDDIQTDYRNGIFEISFRRKKGKRK